MSRSDPGERPSDTAVYAEPLMATSNMHQTATTTTTVCGKKVAP